ncbi:DMT family transporter [Gracilibacillus xinjiangensis]|uniref:DMT family transporter n=1 Tax=Gracilibacillus xinjiangensis TaxID=1193282 RepID=A0ABV8WSG1_9BACI
MKSNRMFPYLAITIGVIAVSSAAIFVKMAGDVPAAIIANYRLLFAAILMLPFVYIKKAELRSLDKRDWGMTILAGISIAIHFIIWFESLNYTSVASSVVLVTLQPVFAFIGTSIFFKEKFAPGTIISMFIAIFGSIIIAWGDFQIAGEALYGDILALVAAVFITIYFLLGQSVRKKVSMVTYTCVSYLSGSIVLIIYNMIAGNSYINYSSDEWLIFLSIAVIPTLLGLNLLNWALKWVSTSIISMGIVFEPVGAAMLAYFILGEKVSWVQWLGGMIVVFGLLLFIASTRRKRRMKVTITP